MSKFKEVTDVGQLIEALYEAIKGDKSWLNGTVVVHMREAGEVQVTGIPIVGYPYGYGLCEHCGWNHTDGENHECPESEGKVHVLAGSNHA